MIEVDDDVLNGERLTFREAGYLHIVAWYLFRIEARHPNHRDHLSFVRENIMTLYDD